MSEKDHESNEATAATLGALLAMQAAIRALASSHPNPDLLRSNWLHEQETSLAWLLNAPVLSEQVRQHFEDTLGSMASALPPSQ